MTDQKMPDELRSVKLPDILPMLPLFNVVVFPRMMFPLEVAGIQSTALVDEAMANDRLTGLITSKNFRRKSNTHRMIFIISEQAP